MFEGSQRQHAALLTRANASSIVVGKVFFGGEEGHRVGARVYSGNLSNANSFVL